MTINVQTDDFRKREAEPIWPRRVVVPPFDYFFPDGVWSRGSKFGRGRARLPWRMGDGGLGGVV